MTRRTRDLEYTYIDKDGNLLEEHIGRDGNWSSIPDGAIAVQVRIKLEEPILSIGSLATE